MPLDRRLKLAFVLLTSVAVICVRLWILSRGKSVIFTEVLLQPTPAEVVPPSFSPTGEFLFRPFEASSRLIAVSAYWQSAHRQTRVFLLKQVDTRPLIQCSFETAGGTTTSWTASHDCNGRFYRYTEWNEFTATLRGFSICCTLAGSDVVGYQRKHEYTTLRLALMDEHLLPRFPVVRLPIGRALPEISKNSNSFPYKFAVCIAPMFNSEIYTTRFLVEYLELHRAIGAQLIIVYLSAKPTPEVSLVLGNYEAWTGTESHSFRVIVVRWYLATYMDPESTWARTQIIAYNDCIYRYAHQAEYFILSDLDEVLVPTLELGYSWSNLVSALQRSAGENFSTACSCELRFWLQSPVTNSNVTTLRSVFFADRTTRPECIHWRKCFLRSGLVRLFHVHEALEPRGFYAADDIFSVYHYRHCNGACTPDPGVPVRINRRLWPLRRRLQSGIDLRLVQTLSDNYSLA